MFLLQNSISIKACSSSCCLYKYLFIMHTVTLPLLESYLNWVADTMPPPTRRLDDLTSPASVENTPPTDSSRKLPRRLRPRRRRGMQSASSANENSAPSTVTRPRSTANRNSPIPGNQPGISQPMRSTPVEHPQTFLRPQHSQSPSLRTNRNSERRSHLDHPESPAQHQVTGQPKKGPCQQHWLA